MGFVDAGTGLTEQSHIRVSCQIRADSLLLGFNFSFGCRLDALRRVDGLDSSNGGGSSNLWKQ